MLILQFKVNMLDEFTYFASAHIHKSQARCLKLNSSQVECAANIQ